MERHPPKRGQPKQGTFKAVMSMQSNANGHYPSWKIGVIGLGKLGMPVALAMSIKGHDVMGYDIDPARMQKEVFPHQEIGPNGEPSIEPLLRASSIRFGSIDEVVRHSEIVFVAVQ